MPWWNAQTHADRRPLLALRGRIKTGLRTWFEAEGFSEVECGALAASPGNEAHLHAFATSRIRADGTQETLYLHTSPEFAAKKLLSAGETRIFEFARVFRNRERTRLHAPEFTMLEWYRAGENVDRSAGKVGIGVRNSLLSLGVSSYPLVDPTDGIDRNVRGEPWPGA